MIIIEANGDIPERATGGSAGLDLVSQTTGILYPGQFRLFNTGLRLAIPEGYEGQVRPRSGLALKHGVTVLNAPGTIDSDYRGEVGVILINHGGVAFKVEAGMRIAQLVIAQVTPVYIRPVAHLPQTPRGAGGFGSTGR